MRDNFYSLPTDLPIPQDDGACRHLEGLELPSIELRSTSNRALNVAELTQVPTVFFFYPRTGRPDQDSPLGWDEIPGARGCTPQSCGYRDQHTEFQQLGYQVFGVSTQSTGYQQELVDRLHLPYEVLSDASLALTTFLKLPTFLFESDSDTENKHLLKRMAWVCNQGKIVKVFYPVFPPDGNAETVLSWIKGRS